MRADKLCLNCEWWETRWLHPDTDWTTEKADCLRWPGQRKQGDERCWQHVKRTKDTEESVEFELAKLADQQNAHVGKLEQDLRDAIYVGKLEQDLRDATRLVLEAGLATGHAVTCVDLISEVLVQVRELQEQAQPQENVAYMNLKLMQARRIIQYAYDKPSPGAAWEADAKAWLESGEADVKVWLESGE